MNEEEKIKAEKSKRITLAICLGIIFFFGYQMVNTYIDYKVEILSYEKSYKNLVEYQEKDIERLKNTIELLKALKNGDANATK